jgi:hypothetical protein
VGDWLKRLGGHLGRWFVPCVNGLVVVFGEAQLAVAFALFLRQADVPCLLVLVPPRGVLLFADVANATFAAPRDGSARASNGSHQINPTLLVGRLFPCDGYRIPEIISPVNGVKLAPFISPYQESGEIKTKKPRYHRGFLLVSSTLRGEPDAGLGCRKIPCFHGEYCDF